MTIPALVLLYSAIDIAAGLASENPKIRDGKRFMKWVNHYMAPEKSLSCTALELYGARCGLVHGFGPVSDLSQKGRTKQILYAEGESYAAKLLELTALSQIDSYVVVHVDDLFKAVREGIEVFLDDAAKNSALSERVNRKGLSVFARIADAEVDALLEWGKKILSGGS